MSFHPGLRPERADLKPKRTLFWPGRIYFSSERAYFKPERADFRPERAWELAQMDKRTNKRKSPVFYRTSSPSGLLPCFLSLQFTIMQSRATGIADHILPLGDLLDASS